jgi:hypothetical protein
METIPTPVQDGDILLGPAWLLTTNHRASSHGQPVLVNRHNGHAFGPGDLVTLGKEVMPAAMLVAWLARTLTNQEQRAVVERFCQQGQQ